MSWPKCAFGGVRVAVRCGCAAATTIVTAATTTAAPLFRIAERPAVLLPISTSWIKANPRIVAWAHRLKAEALRLLPLFLRVRTTRFLPLGDRRLAGEARGDRMALPEVDAEGGAGLAEELAGCAARLQHAASGVHLRRQQVVAELVRQGAPHRTPHQLLAAHQRHLLDDAGYRPR